MVRSGGIKLDAAGLPRGVQVNQTLVGAAAETQGDILQLLHEAAVHQDIQQGEQFIRRLTAGMASLRQQFVVGEASETPNGKAARTRRTKGSSTRWFSGSKGSPPSRVRPLI